MTAKMSHTRFSRQPRAHRPRKNKRDSHGSPPIVPESIDHASSLDRPGRKSLGTGQVGVEGIGGFVADLRLGHLEKCRISKLGWIWGDGVVRDPENVSRFHDLYGPLRRHTVQQFGIRSPE
jgi:hypothetical protein